MKSVNNSIKHSSARNLEVRLIGREEEIVVQVEDDGIGLRKESAANPGMGLKTMTYRANLIGADIRILASPAGGTTMECRLARSRLATVQASVTENKLAAH